jgi:hypothetical protein
MKRSVFFSWQLDTKTKVGRNLIERALEQALKDLAKDPAIAMPERELFVDRDTVGVPGTPPIVETIFAKIDNAYAFVPDLTFVGQRIDKRPTPNPNVLIEYGWAAKSLGYSRLVPVMNVAFGEPTAENMPFDLRHLRNPITFNLPPDANDEAIAEAKASLAKAFRTALNQILTSAALSDMSLDRSFGNEGTAVLPEKCFTPGRIQVQSAGILVAGHVDGIPHVANLTPGGQCTDLPIADEEFERCEKVYGGTFLFCGSSTLLGGTPALQQKLITRDASGRWIVADEQEYDFALSGTQAFTGRLGQGRLLLLDQLGEKINLQLQIDARFIHDGVHTIKRQGNYLYLYWVPAPRLHHGSIAKFDLDGRLDQSFGDAGIVNFPTETGSRGRVLNFLHVSDVLVQPDSKILVGGWGNDANVIRLLPDGRRDTTFGTNGAIVFRAEERSTLIRLFYESECLYAFGDQNGANTSAQYVARIDHGGRLLGHINLKGKGQSSVKDVEIYRGTAYMLCHFNADASMYSSAAVHKIVVVK